ncbi:hypothetical protein JCM12856_29140 [Spirochaeta dissipatitropha]
MIVMVREDEEKTDPRKDRKDFLFFLPPLLSFCNIRSFFNNTVSYHARDWLSNLEEMIHWLTFLLPGAILCFETFGHRLIIINGISHENV